MRAPPCPPFPFTFCIPIHFYEIAPCAISGKTKKENSALMRNSLLVFLSGAAHSRMKLPGFPGSCNYVVNSLRQLVETLDPSPEYTYRHLFYEVVVIISFGTWKVYGQSFSKNRHVFVTITDFRMSYVLFPHNFNILFSKSQMSFFVLDFQFHLTCASSAAFSCSIAFTTVARGQARLKRSNCAVSGPNTLPESSHSFASSTIRCSSSSSVNP